MKERLNRIKEMQFRAPSADTESNRILTESKPEVQKMSVCSKSREITAESKGATRFSNTSVDVQQIIVTNARNGKQKCETKSGIKSYTLWQLAQSFY